MSSSASINSETAARERTAKLGSAVRRLAVFDTHPIQYFAPLWRRLAAMPEIELVVHYLSDHSVRGGIDPGFGVPVAWDTPLTEGYEYRFVRRDADVTRPQTVTIPNVEQILREGKFDAAFVHGYKYPFSRQVVRAAHGMKLGVILRGEFTDMVAPGGRSVMKTVMRNAYLRWFYHYVDSFCYIGEEAKTHLARRGISARRMFFSPYAVDARLFEQEKRQFQRSAVRAELGIGENQQVFLFTGKLIPRKAPMLLMQALAKLPDTSKVMLILVGDGPLRGEVEAAGRKILGDRLMFTGFVNQSQIGKYYAASDVFVLPSQFETWGLVVNEAMNFGLPVVISSNVGCRRDLVTEGETGFSFENGEAADLARCLANFVNDTQLAPRLGRNALARIAKYSIDNCAAGVAEAVMAATEDKSHR